MECSRCNQPIPEGEECNYRGKLMCEDCYIQAVEPLKTCDVAAVHSAKTHRAASGQTGVEGLTELQKSICQYVNERTKVTKPELLKAFDLPARELDKLISILRHCELIKARKIENEIYIVPFDFE